MYPKLTRALDKLRQQQSTGHWSQATWVSLKQNRIKLYVRITKRYVISNLVNTLDIATIEIAEPYRGRGLFTGVLYQCEQYAAEHNLIVYVESIVEPRLKSFLLNRGYICVYPTDGDSLPAYMVNRLS